MTYDNHAPHIACHYTRAKEKHPDFATRLTNWDVTMADYALANARTIHAAEPMNAQHTLACEVAEVMEAYAHGWRAHAIAECYDAVAVLLRMVDFIEAESEAAK